MEGEKKQVVIQARAVATRRRILDAATTLFAESGYGDTGLAEVLQRSSVSKGAFYYHFQSKEAVAAAIIAEFEQRCGEVVDKHFDPAAPRLEGIIRATFDVQALMRSDMTFKIGQELSQALYQISTEGARMYTDWTARFADMVCAVADAGELCPDVDATDAAEAIWVGVLGSHLVSAAVGDDPHARLARSWRVLLRSLLPPDSLPEFDVLLRRIAGSYPD